MEISDEFARQIYSRGYDNAKGFLRGQDPFDVALNGKIIASDESVLHLIDMSKRQHSGFWVTIPLMFQLCILAYKQKAREEGKDFVKLPESMADLPLPPSPPGWEDISIEF